MSVTAPRAESNPIGRRDSSPRGPSRVSVGAFMVVGITVELAWLAALALVALWLLSSAVSWLLG